MTHPDNDRLHEQLIKLADIMETCEPGSEDFKYYNKEYKAICKILFPDMHPKKARKPNQRLISQLKPCDCGNKGWMHKQNLDGITIYCKQCDRTSKAMKTNELAVISWNETFKK